MNIRAFLRHAKQEDLIMSQHSTDAKPWFKSFWPWFVISLPAAGVIAGIATVIIAVQNAPVITDGEIGRFARESVSTEAVKAEAIPAFPASKQ